MMIFTITVDLDHVTQADMDTVEAYINSLKALSMVTVDAAYGQPTNTESEQS